MGEVLRECDDAAYESVQAATEGVLLVLKKFMRLIDTATCSKNAMETNEQPPPQLANVESYEQKAIHALKELANKWKDWLNRVLPYSIIDRSYYTLVIGNPYELKVRLQVSLY